MINQFSTDYFYEHIENLFQWVIPEYTESYTRRNLHAHKKKQKKRIISAMLALFPNGILLFPSNISVKKKHKNSRPNPKFLLRNMREKFTFYDKILI
jgi:hypothetical protein